MAQKFHKITGNESVGTIAGMYGVTPQTLLESNPGVSTLAAGAFLRVPGPVGAVGKIGNASNLSSILSGQYANNYQTASPQSAAAGTSLSGVPITGYDNQSVIQYQNNPNAPGRTETLKSKIPATGSAGGNVWDETTGPKPQTPTAGYTARGTFGQLLPQANQPIQEGEPQFSNPGQTNTNGLNAQQIAKLNLQNAANTFKPSSQLLNWNQQVSNGTPTPLTANMFQELTTISVNSGIPRDAAIQAVNSLLKGKGYVYNPITKGYVSGGPTGGSAPANGQAVKDINAVSTNNGQFSKDSWENYKQKTIASGGKRWWIKGGRGGGQQEQQQAATVAAPADGGNAVTSSGQANSIWRIG